MHPPTRFWEAPLHDMQCGGITAVAMSFDDAYLITAAADGSMYVFTNNIDASISQQPGEPEQLPAMAVLDAPQVR